MFFPTRQPEVYPTAYAIVVLPDSRILAVRSIRKTVQHSTSNDWTCTVSTEVRPDEDVEKVLQDKLRSQLCMDVNVLEGQIGTRRYVTMQNSKLIIQAYRVARNLLIKMDGSLEARAFTYNRILDLLENSNTRLDFSYDTEKVFKSLFEGNWRPR